MHTYTVGFTRAQNLGQAPKWGRIQKQEYQKPLGRDSKPVQTELVPVKLPAVRKERKSCPIEHLSTLAQTELEKLVTWLKPLPVSRKERRRVRHSLNWTMPGLKFRTNFIQPAVALHSCKTHARMQSRSP